MRVDRVLGLYIYIYINVERKEKKMVLRSYDVCIHLAQFGDGKC